MPTQTFYSNGKLLLTGEYLVIDGAKALAIPTNKGQSLSIKELEIENSKLNWESWTHNNECWLKVKFSLPNLSIEKTSDPKKALWLQKLLISVRELNPSFLTKNKAIEASTYLNFPRDWGLGSSSTLINNVAQWAKVDPFKLHFSVSNGSGYDIACANFDSPLIYSVKNQTPLIEQISLPKEITDNIFFVHLNQKQNSFDAVNSYNEIKKEIDLKICIQSIDEITNLFIQAKSIEEWENAMDSHEFLISNILQQETIKEKLFPLYPNSIKSLGAWGGDFIMATGPKVNQTYFKERGYTTIIDFNEMLLKDIH